ncbi:MAG: hypothetical protein RBR35_07835 [Salinivirgaceae bacterium]|nr:hypothetical protein [Salinivirgaceae bacterium]
MKQKLSLLLMFGLLLGFSSCNLFEKDETDKIIQINDDVTQATVWQAGNVYIIDGSLSIKADIIIEAGAEIRFNQGASIHVAYYSDNYAKIVANGTAEKPIRFTSNASSPVAGNWETIGFYAGAENSEFTHCIFEYGGSNDNYGAMYINSTSVKFTNCQFIKMANSAIRLNDNGFFSEFTNNSFSLIEKHAIRIESNKVHTIGINNTFDLNERYGIEVSKNFNIAGDYTWLTHATPYIVADNIYIGAEGNGINLTINPGVKLQFITNAGFVVAYPNSEYAKIIAKGTEQNPILFTSNHPSPQAGSYMGLSFYDGSQQSVFEYCTIEYAGKEDNNSAIYINSTAIKFNNCKFDHNLNNTIRLKDSGYFTAFTNNTFSNVVHYPIEIEANYVHTIGAGNTFNSGAFGILVEENLDKSGSFTWLKHDAPYVINHEIVIGAEGNGATLIIAPGTTLKFNIEKGFTFGYHSNNYGKIIAEGTVAEPIIFTSSKTVPGKGDWKGIYLYASSNGSSMKHCEVLYAGSDFNYGAIMLDDTGLNTITIDNSRIAYSASYGISVDSNSSVDISTDTFDNNNGADYHER